MKNSHFARARESLNRTLSIAALTAAALASPGAWAGIDSLDSSSMVSSSSGELGCFAPNKVAFSAGVRLPAVADQVTRIELFGTGLRADDYEFSLAQCNGACSILSATGSGGTKVDIKARLGGAGTGTMLRARKKSAKESSTIHFDIVPGAQIADVAPRDGVRIGTVIEARGTGLAPLEIGQGKTCFEVLGKSAEKITLKSKCEVNSPTGTSGEQRLSFVQGSACKIARQDAIRLAVTPAANAPKPDLVPIGVEPAFTFKVAAGPDRRVADGLCSGASTALEVTCTVTKGSAKDGVPDRSDCGPKPGAAQAYIRTIQQERVSWGVKNESDAVLERPFNAKLLGANGAVLQSERLQSIAARGQRFFTYLRPVRGTVFVKVFATSGAAFQSKYGGQGCFRAVSETMTGQLASFSPSGDNYTEVFTVRVDSENEIDEGVNEANNEKTS